MRFKSLYIYFVTAILSLVCVGVVMELWRADFNIPFAYEWKDLKNGGDALDPNGSADALCFYAFFKGVYENGWYLNNPLIGMPSGLECHDFPNADSLHFFLIKVIGWFAPSYAWAVNIYFLLGFVLTALTTCFVYRQLKIHDSLAVGFGLLFAFLPYHFLRGEQNLFLASYFMVPLMVLVLIWTIENNVLFEFSEKHKWIPRGITKNGYFSFGVCVLMGCAGLYYSVFGGFLLVMGCTIRQRRLKDWIPSLLLIGVIILSLVANAIPTIIYYLENGRNADILSRLRADGELYGLKMIQMLLPVMHHRIEAFANSASFYYKNAPLITENDTATLGLIGSFGFVLMMARVLGIKWQTSRQELVLVLSRLTLCCFLLATIGGIGSILCFEISALIRGYNRISVYIAFFSFLILAFLIEHARSRFALSSGAKAMWMGLLALLFLVGLADQTTPFFVPPYAQNLSSFRSDEEFVKRIESSVPGGSMIFQLPYSPFISGPLKGYSLLRGYLHSTKLRWSYGSMPGRKSDMWVRTVVFSDGDLSRIVWTVKRAGFKGIYIDRELLPDYQKVEQALRQIADPSPLESQNGKLAFYSLIKSK
jgi:phosphoglycerol transferase